NYSGTDNGVSSIRLQNIATISTTTDRLNQTANLAASCRQTRARIGGMKAPATKVVPSHLGDVVTIRAMLTSGLSGWQISRTFRTWRNPCYTNRLSQVPGEPFPTSPPG